MPQDGDEATPTLLPPEKGITVRMYNPGFGDCFLLAFRCEDGKGRYMLLDFGIHHSYPDRKEMVKRIAKDIAKATGNRLHVVAITHEHTDHLYGFKYAREEFDVIDVDELWLSWAEDPEDTVAKELKDLYGLKIRALSEVVKALDDEDRQLTSALLDIRGFEIDDIGVASTNEEEDPLVYLKNKTKKKLKRGTDYRRPCEAPLTLPCVKGVKIYVLGPPRAVKWIRSLERKSELYPTLTFTSEITSFTAAALALKGSRNMNEEEQELYRRNQPFDPIHRLSYKEAEAHPVYSGFFKETYGFPEDGIKAKAWRRIETDWLNTGENLALDINNKVNNTSLVLAIELTEPRPSKVLLFAGDAQVGNWLSWQELEWEGEGVDEEVVDIDYLLKRTVLYKVGHHGSHNATLSHKGLEMMDSPELVAMIPVDKEWAHARNWKHPAEHLLERLEERTLNRIIRTDNIPSGNVHPPQPAEATESEWQAFTRNLDWDRGEHKLWIQFTVS